jgi:hypothetical protein
MEQQHERNKMMNKYSLIFLVFLVACNTGYAVTDTSDAAVVPDVALDSTVSDDASVLVQDSSAPDAATPYCGDGVVNDMEQCDGNDLGELTCQTFGYLHGSLVCNSSCAVDVSGCNNVTVCGDGAAEGTEECDEADFKGQWCGDVPGFVAGQLVCTASCTVSTALFLVVAVSLYLGGTILSRRYPHGRLQLKLRLIRIYIIIQQLYTI